MAPAVVIAARTMIRRALKGTLATRDVTSGAPYASMILVATAFDGAPVTLISSLARHTQNLRVSADASLLIDFSNSTGDAQSGGRITLMGTFALDASLTTRVRFLARHPSATAYADFADFSFWRMDITSAHMIEGFGRIVPLPGDVLRSTFDVAAFAAAAPHHLDLLQQRWPDVIGLDPEGVDLMQDGSPQRIVFETPVLTAEFAYATAANCLVKYCSAQ